MEDEIIGREANRLAGAARESRREQVDREFKGIHFSRDTSKITTAKGQNLGDVEGLSYKGLLVHSVGEKKYHVWQITHQESGKSPGPRFGSQNAAKLFVYRLSQVSDLRHFEDLSADARARIFEACTRLTVDEYADLSDLEGLPTAASSQEEAGEHP